VLYTKDKKTLVKCPPKKTSLVAIPEGVTTIGENSFKLCDQIESIDIPDSVTEMNVGTAFLYSSFEGCANLTSFNVSNGNETYQSIDGNLYSKDGTKFVCYAPGKTATEFTVPSHVTIIEPQAFNSSKLESIIVPDSVTSIEGYAFMGCENLKSIAIGSGYKGIGLFSPFSGNENLKRIDFSRSVKVVAIGNTTASKVFGGTHDALQIKVPANLYVDWVSDSQWSEIADRIVKEFSNTL
jgi:hypothetical protein